jgi:hypothetical protein
MVTLPFGISQLSPQALKPHPPVGNSQSRVTEDQALVRAARVISWEQQLNERTNKSVAAVPIREEQEATAHGRREPEIVLEARVVSPVEKILRRPDRLYTNALAPGEVLAGIHGYARLCEELTCIRVGECRAQKRRMVLDCRIQSCWRERIRKVFCRNRPAMVVMTNSLIRRESWIPQEAAMPLGPSKSRRFCDAVRASQPAKTRQHPPQHYCFQTARRCS